MPAKKDDTKQAPETEPVPETEPTTVPEPQAEATVEVSDVGLDQLQAELEAANLRVTNLETELDGTPSSGSFRGSAFVDLYGSITDEHGLKHLVEIKVTQHSWVDAYHALVGVTECISRCRELNLKPYHPTRTLGVAPKQAPAASAPAQPAVTKPPPATPADTPPPTPPAAPTQPAAPAAPAQPAGEQTQTDTGDMDNPLRVVKMEIEPLPEGRANLLLYAPNHRYSDLRVPNWPNDRLCELLAPTGAWELAHMQNAAEYSVEYIIHWEYSQKLNSQGNRYRNVTEIKPA